jgi:hypothetical protein
MDLMAMELAPVLAQELAPVSVMDPQVSVMDLMVMELALVLVQELAPVLVQELAPVLVWGSWRRCRLPLQMRLALQR